MRRLSVLPLLLTLPLHATETDTDKKCDPKQSNCDDVITFSTVTVEANRSATDLAKYAGSVGVIEEEDLKQNNQLVDALSDVTGVETGGDNGRTIGSQFTIRGFGYQSEQRVIIQQDGVPQSPSLFSNHISSFRTDTDILKRVEVVKGASSILHGSGAIGGIVSMQTKGAKDYLDEDQQLGFLLGQRYESNNMHSTRAGLMAQGKTLPVDLFLYGKTAQYDEMELADGGTENYSEVPNDERINTALMKLGWDISTNQRLSVSVFDFDEELTTVWQTLYHTESSIPIIGDLKQTDYVLDYEALYGNASWLNLTAKLYSTEAEYDRGYKTETRDLRYANKDERWGIKLKNVAYFNAIGAEHQFVLGLDYANRQESALYLLNDEYTDFGSMPNEYNDLGIYFQDLARWGNFELTLGGRFDNFERSVDNKPNADYDDSRFSPRVAVAYEALPGFNLLLGYSESFRAPTPHETSSEGPLNPHYYYLPNPDLKAETAEEIEGGFSYHGQNLFSAQDQLSIKATYFHGDIKDMITLKKLPEAGTPPESTMYAQYQNVDNARRKGYEVQANYGLGPVLAGLSFEHLELYDKQTKENVNQAFADKLHGDFTWFFDSLDLRLGAEVNHWFEPDQNPKTITSRGKTYTYVDQSFTQVNLKGAWTPQFSGVNWLDDKMRLNFGVNNLFDKKYINASNVNSTSRVGTGTNIYIDLEFEI